jgi:hypothetical protein
MDEYETSVKLSKVREFRRACCLGLCPCAIVSTLKSNMHAHTSQISFASNYFYDFGMGFPKLSMLAFYWAFFDLHARPAMRKMLWAITAFVVVCYLTILFDDTFFCGSNVSVQWSQEEGACSVFYAPEPFILNFTLNLACYLAVYAVPLVLLSQGILRSSTGVTLTFGLGALTIASSIVRFVTLKVGTGQPNLVCKYLEIITFLYKADSASLQIPSAWLRWHSQSLSLLFLDSSRLSEGVRRLRYISLCVSAVTCSGYRAMYELE